MHSELLLDFLAANTLLEDITIHCTNISDPPDRAVVPLDHLRQLSLITGHAAQNLLQCLQLPSTTRVDLFLDHLPEGKLLWELLPSSLQNLPGIAETSLLHCNIVVGSNQAGGTITVRGDPAQLLAGKPINLRPSNLGAVREIVVSSRIRPFASIWSRFRQAIQDMSGVETLVVGSRVPLHDLPAVLMVKDLLPNLFAIALVAPSLDEIARFASSVIARNGMADVRRIEFLGVLCPRYEEDLITEAVKRPSEGWHVGLVEVRSVQDVGSVWVKSINWTIEREFFR